MFSQVQSYESQVLCIKSTLGQMGVLQYTLFITALLRNFSTSLYLRLNLFRKTKNAMHTTHHGAKFLLVLNQLEVAQQSVPDNHNHRDNALDAGDSAARFASSIFLASSRSASAPEQNPRLALKANV